MLRPPLACRASVQLHPWNIFSSLWNSTAALRHEGEFVFHTSTTQQEVFYVHNSNKSSVSFRREAEQPGAEQTETGSDVLPLLQRSCDHVSSPDTSSALITTNSLNLKLMFKLWTFPLSLFLISYLMLYKWEWIVMIDSWDGLVIGRACLQ